MVDESPTALKTPPSRTSAAQAAYRLENPEKYRSGSARYRENHPDRVAAYRSANRERSAEYRANNKARIAEKMAAYRATHAVEIAAVRAKWAKDNADKRRVHAHNRRALVRSDGGRLSVGIAELLYDKQRGLCACCGASLSDGYHLDHIMPIALGGANVDANIQLLTPGCNSRKWAKHPDDYAARTAYKSIY